MLKTLKLRTLSIPGVILVILFAAGFKQVKKSYLHFPKDTPIDEHVNLMKPCTYFDAAYVRKESQGRYNVHGYFHTFFPWIWCLYLPIAS